LIITNINVLFIEKTSKLRNRIRLSDIKGMMFYFYDKRHNVVHLEQSNGQVVKI